MRLLDVYLKVLEMSSAALVAAMVVLPAALLLWALKAPKRAVRALWLVILFRLLCPVALPTPLSLMNVPYLDQQAEAYVWRESSEWKTFYTSMAYEGDERYKAWTQAGVEPQSLEDGGQRRIYSVQNGDYVAYGWDIARDRAILWVAFAGLAAAFGIGGYVFMRRRVRYATLLQENVYETDRIDVPFVLGIFRPRIYLPVGIGERDLPFILEHERAHIRSGDHIVKVLAYAALCLHIMNPAVPLCLFMLLTLTMEEACDERVLTRMGEQARADYGESLLRFSTYRSQFIAPLAYGESKAGARIKKVLKWKKPKRWTVVLGVILCLTACLAGATDRSPSPPRNNSVQWLDGLTFNGCFVTDMLYIRNFAYGENGQVGYQEQPARFADSGNMGEGRYINGTMYDYSANHGVQRLNTVRGGYGQGICTNVDVLDPEQLANILEHPDAVTEELRLLNEYWVMELEKGALTVELILEPDWCSRPDESEGTPFSDGTTSGFLSLRPADPFRGDAAVAEIRADGYSISVIVRPLDGQSPTLQAMGEEAVALACEAVSKLAERPVTFAVDAD